MATVPLATQHRHGRLQGNVPGGRSEPAGTRPGSHRRIARRHWVPGQLDRTRLDRFDLRSSRIKPLSAGKPRRFGAARASEVAGHGERDQDQNRGAGELGDHADAEHEQGYQQP
jgi:hypothetical protein